METRDSDFGDDLDEALLGGEEQGLDLETDRRLRITFRVSALEADVAYFQARLALLGKPSTLHERAQYNAYRTMEELLRATLRRLRRSSAS